MTTLALTDSSIGALVADALVIGTAKGSGGPILAPGAEGVDEALSGQLRDALAALGATGAEGEVVKLATLGALPGVPVVVAAGLGAQAEHYPNEAVRRASGAATRALAGRGTVASTLALVNGTGEDGPAADLVEAAGTGALLGAYRFDAYRTPTPATRPMPGAVTLVVPDARSRAGRPVLRRAKAVAGALDLCRDLVNTPPNDLYPAEFAARVEKAAVKLGIEVEVLDERALKRGGYGGILGVGSGSSHPPRLVRLRYRGRGAKARVALVGKGITFDSGGISLKPATNMDAMKSDMAGAAAIAATVILVATLKVPVEVVATVPVAENLPGGSAYRPSDVLSMYSGTRVEVLNTDAEGRLILADAIARACEDGPDYLLETSTLTGAQVTALGSRTAGVMGSDELRDRVVAAGQRVGEGMWPMPMPAELRRTLDTPVADFANVAGGGRREGGMLVAAHFLSEFVAKGVAWAHIDVAGPAYNTDEPWGYTPRGGTGVPIRTLFAVVEDIAAHG
ncbi:MAG TPA: leucyl aminopeptidase [Mycobacteriales bacterium]|nr:leucyl aminopeptidase [Mycobacteriales bacterium]